MRPNLEALEDRLAPTGATINVPSPAPAAAVVSASAAALPSLGTTITISNISTKYTLFTQVETVTAQVGGPVGMVVNEGSVTFTDNGQTKILPVQNGTATATFTFNLFQFQENPNAHTVTASYTDINGPSGFTSSNTSSTAPATTTAYFFQLYFDILLFSLFTSSTSTSGSSSSSSSGG